MLLLFHSRNAQSRLWWLGRFYPSLNTLNWKTKSSADFILPRFDGIPVNIFDLIQKFFFWICLNRSFSYFDLLGLFLFLCLFFLLSFLFLKPFKIFFLTGWWFFQLCKEGCSSITIKRDAKFCYFCISICIAVSLTECSFKAELGIDFICCICLVVVRVLFFLCCLQLADLSDSIYQNRFLYCLFLS